jgi:hypothetical protein
MSKKASMELSVNSIVILVIAIVMMGLILGFIQSKFKDVSKNLIQEEPVPNEASASDPMTLSRTTVVTSSGQKVAIKMNIFNTENTTMQDVYPRFSCKPPLTVTADYFNRSINPASQVAFEGTLKPNSVAKDTYLCQVCYLRKSTAQKDAAGNYFFKASAPAPTNTCDSYANTETLEAYKEFTLIIQ